METILLALPVLPGKQEAWRRFCQELQGLRRTEYEASRQRLGIAEEAAWLVPSAAGEMAVLLLKAVEPDHLLARLGASSAPFDCWFRRKVRELHGVDLTQPPPMPHSEQIFVWQTDQSINSSPTTSFPTQQEAIQ